MVVTVLIGLVMFLALVGMIICSKKQKTSPAAQPIAIGLLIVVVICGVAMLHQTGVLGGGNDFQKIENQYYAAQGNVIGKFIKQNFPGKKVLVLMERDFEKNPRTKILEEALKAGADGNMDVVVDTITLSKAPKSQGPDAFEMPLFEVMTAADFDNAINQHKDAGVIISTIGLPRDVQKMKLWKMSKDKRPGVVLLSAVDMRGYDGMIKAGMISGIVTVGPDAKFTEDAPPSDPQKAFDVRYVLIDGKNVEKFANMFR